MLRPQSMVKFYAAIPQEYEDKVIEELGKLGIIHPTREMAQIGEEPHELEHYDRFFRVFDRGRHLLINIHKFRGGEKQPGVPFGYSKISIEELDRIVEEYEPKIGEIGRRFDELQRRYEELKDVTERIIYMGVNNMRLDEVGDFQHMFVRAGLMKADMAEKLDEYLREFKVVYTVRPGRKKKEVFVVVSGLNEYKTYVDKALDLLNFTPFTFPEGLSSDPKKAIDEVKEEIGKIMKEVEGLESELKGYLDSLGKYAGYISFLRRAKSSLMKTRTVTLLSGWAPKKYIPKIREIISSETSGVGYIRFRDPKPGENVPVSYRFPPLLRSFELLTNLQGTPSYYEINPTILYTVFFTLMYGMMFGDIGEGAILFVLGLLLLRVKRPLLGMSARALRRLGAIIAASAFMAMVFGYLYGVLFLYEFREPIFIRPIHDVNDIIVISLVFGVLQIVLGLLLNMVNHVIEKSYAEAVFSWKGVVGLVYYISGIMLAIAFIKGGMRIEVLVQPQNLPYLYTSIAMLGLSIFSPAIVAKIHGEGITGESIMEGIGEVIELFFSYISNSISYVRLAAFAIAHEALGLAAELLGGGIPAYIGMNVLGVLIEGFTAGIQAIRLVYYEFSTKFYRGTGLRYNPLRLRAR